MNRSMKKNLFFGLMALAGLFTSCSQDDTDASPTADSNQVSMSIGMPADFVKTRASAPATFPAGHTLRCILEVWDTETTPALKIRKEICPAVGDTEIDFSFDLATAGTYKALLWADYIPTSQGTTSQEIAGLTGVDSYGDNYYITTNGLKEVEISINIPQKPEVVDAFFASAEFTKAEKALTIPTVTLTRPFMKLTIAEKNADRFASCERVTVEFSSPSKFDVATGTVIGTQSRNITVTNEWLNYGNDITIGGQTCKTLICLYVLANAADATMGDIKLEFTSSEQGKSLPTVTIPAGIPLKRNYCVNAAGNLIGKPSSSAVNMTVDINSDWTGTEEETISAKVGDYYYKDGTWSTDANATSTNPIIGVVYQVNADGTGKVVSLTEETSLTWGPDNVTTGTTSSTNGKENTDKVFALIANQSYTLSDYPIFNACQELRTSTVNDRWCVPAREEYVALFKVVSTINDKIRAISGTTVIAPDKDVETSACWTSRESSTMGAYLMTSGTGSINTNKGNARRVRFILDF